MRRQASFQQTRQPYIQHCKSIIPFSPSFEVLCKKTKLNKKTLSLKAQKGSD